MAWVNNPNGAMVYWSASEEQEHLNIVGTATNFRNGEFGRKYRMGQSADGRCRWLCADLYSDTLRLLVSLMVLTMRYGLMQMFPHRCFLFLKGKHCYLQP